MRWLRPAYQIPRFARGRVAGPEVVRDLVGAAPDAAAKAKAPLFPRDLRDQQREVIEALARARAPLSAADIAARYRGRGVADQVARALRALARDGVARTPDAHSFVLQRAA